MAAMVTGVIAMLGAAPSAMQHAYPPPADLQTYYIYFLNKGPNYGKIVEAQAWLAAEGIMLRR